MDILATAHRQIEKLQYDQRQRYLQGRAEAHARTALGRAMLRFADRLADGADLLDDGADLLDDRAERLENQADNRTERISRDNQHHSDKLLLLVLGRQRAEEALGDLNEIYLSEHTEHGRACAARRYKFALLGLIARRLCSVLVGFALRKST